MNVAGKLFLIDTVSIPAVDVEMLRAGSAYFTAPSVGRGFRIFGSAPFSGVRIMAAAGTVLSFFIADEDVQIDTFTGASVVLSGGVVINNGVLNPVPVNILGATLTVNNVGINNADVNPVPVRAQALTVHVDNAAPMVVSGVPTLLSNDAGLRKLIIRNNDLVNVLTLGGVTVTAVGGAIKLLPGDVWIEQDGAGAAWYGITAGANVNVSIKGMK